MADETTDPRDAADTPAPRVLAPRRPAFVLAAAISALSGHDAANTLALVRDWPLTILDTGVQFDDLGGPCAILRWQITDPAAAWLALACAGLVPLDAVTDWDRRTPCKHVWYCVLRQRLFDDEPCPDCIRARAPARIFDHGEGAYPAEYPRTVADAVALAADWAGVLGAENLAREVVARLGLRAERVVWRVQLRAEIEREAERRAEAWHERLATDDTDAGCMLGCLASLLTGHWPERDYTLASGSFRPATTTHLRLLHDLAWSGYALDAIADDAVVLVAPGL
jgi:hypothetical protein